MRLTVFILEQECEVFVSAVSPLTNGTAACVPCGNTFISCGVSPDITVLPYWVKGPAYTIGHIHRIYASISLIFRSNAFPTIHPKSIHYQLIHFFLMVCQRIGCFGEHSKPRILNRVVFKIFEKVIDIWINRAMPYRIAAQLGDFVLYPRGLMFPFAYWHHITAAVK